MSFLAATSRTSICPAASASGVRICVSMFTSFTSKGMYCSASHWMDSSSSSCVIRGQRDLLDDDRVAADADRDLLRLHLVLRDELLDRLDDGGGVHERAVHDRLGRQRRGAEGQQLRSRPSSPSAGRASRSRSRCRGRRRACPSPWALPTGSAPGRARSRTPSRRSEGVRPSARMILRFVSTRQSRPLSMRETVSGETPALRASSAFVSSCSSRSRCTLLGAARAWTDAGAASLARGRAGMRAPR